MRDNLVQRRSIDILSKLLAEENITVVHDSKAVTAAFFPKERKLVFPTYGDQISTVSQIMLALHETGHATDTPEAVLDLMKVYGRSVVNILEDVRIEKLVKNKLAGATKFFTQGYRELVLEHDFFGTANQENPFDFSHFRFLDRVNVHFKLGAQAMVPFSDAEQVLVDKIAKIETVDDVESLSKLLKEIAKENEKNNNQSSSKGSDDAESDEDYESEDDTVFRPGDDLDRSDQDDSDDDSDSSLDSDSEEPDSEEPEESDDDSEEPDSEAGDDIDIDGSDFGDSEESVNDSEDPEDSSDSNGSEEADDDSEESEDDSDDGLSGTADGGEESEDDSETEFSDPDPEDNNQDIDLDADDLEDSESEKNSAKILEKLAQSSGDVHHIPRSTEIDSTFQPWKDIERFVDESVKQDFRRGYWPDYENVSPVQNLAEYRREVKPLLNKMVSEFNRNSAGTVSRRTSYRDVGVLDPNKMIHYRYNENIFKKRKFVRDGKNHGVCLFVDFTGSMNRRIVPTMRQVVLMIDFCRKINIPFRVYGWSDCYLPSTSGKFNRYEDEVGLVEIFNNNMSSSVLEKYSAWALTGRGMTPGGSTPLMPAMYKALPLIRKFREESKVDVMKFMFFSDGDGHKNMPGWGSYAYVDEETGTQYSSRTLSERFYPGNPEFARYSWKDGQQRQISFLADILKDRYNVDTVFVMMNSSATVRPIIKSGRWSEDDTRAHLSSLREMKIAIADASNHLSIVPLIDGYDIITEKFSMPDVVNATDRVVKTAFVKAGRARKASVLFASEVAKSLAKAA